jgi:hypothetical protein
MGRRWCSLTSGSPTRASFTTRETCQAGALRPISPSPQELTEAAKEARQTLLVVSLPASESGTSVRAQVNDVEVGGLRGREALDRLRNALGRLESSWRPASTEEGFEIVRRRLFEPMTDKSQFLARDSAARSFFDLYRTQHQEFPTSCRDGDYEQRLKAAYPIHPEVFDRLYEDWSTLLKFQRTRGVLRLMAAVSIACGSAATAGRSSCRAASRSMTPGCSSSWGAISPTTGCR